MKNGSQPAEMARTQRKAVYVVLAVVVCAAIAGFWGARITLTQGSSPVERFWSPFFGGNNSLVVYSGLPAGADLTSGNQYAGTYTGVGELHSVYELTRLFDHYHAYFTLQRSPLVNWDQAKFKNLVLIGPVGENRDPQGLPANMDFTLNTGNGVSEIANHHPRPGEQALYSRGDQLPARDYSVIALLLGSVSGNRILVLRGLTTLGTQAAVEFVCHDETIKQLLQAAAGPHHTVKPFQAVIETRLGGGVPLESHLVAMHVH